MNDFAIPFNSSSDYQTPIEIGESNKNIDNDLAKITYRSSFNFAICILSVFFLSWG